MIPLHTQGVPIPTMTEPTIGRITRQAMAAEQRADHVLVIDDSELPAPADRHGYAAVLWSEFSEPAVDSNVVCGVKSLNHLDAGDVVIVRPNGFIGTLYRLKSPHNTLFTTDRCNSYCLMCSQPPRLVADAHVVAELLRLIDLISPDTEELGITGGEPTLLGRGLLTVIERCGKRLPATALHMLSNGRLFRYRSFARDLASLSHPGLVVAVPLYSDIDYAHDYVVQSTGAFADTIRGLENLGRHELAVEIRVVLHQQTLPRLVPLADFIMRNLPFACHVTLMGLEPIGLAVPNLAHLWADPVDYCNELEESVSSLAAAGIPVSIYNHQLCVLPRSLWPFARQAISDWKNEYLPECTSCAVQEECGGFFTSSVTRRVSRAIAPVVAAH
jgi:His-Xaa-Ser system radical SAM maturase HxsC